MNATQQKIQTAFAATLALLFGLTLTLVSCKEKPIVIEKHDTVGEKVEDRIKDGLDARPNEKVRDAVEDIEDAAKEAREDVKDAVNN
ncbi:hypothetical protein WJU23_13065 [Prosthecobacter sp. SYSU 5D2]|uniref:hypothetical protein n=1 Tax=Prosthecobacter sp. SYSU 5D2 TaxID=3134134 RepID=UPI0031FF40DF